MLRRTGIRLTTLFAVLILTAAPANSAAPAEAASGSTVMTPNVWHAWQGAGWSGNHVDLGSAQGQCVRIPFAPPVGQGAGSGINGGDSGLGTVTVFNNLNCSTTNPGDQSVALPEGSYGSFGFQAVAYITQL